jgi:hypothetical protein
MSYFRGFRVLHNLEWFSCDWDREVDVPVEPEFQKDIDINRRVASVLSSNC